MSSLPFPCVSSRLRGITDFIGRPLKMGPLAMRTPAGPGEAFPFFEDVTAVEAACRVYDKSLPLRCQRSPDMGKMLIDLLLSDAQFL